MPIISRFINIKPASNLHHAIRIAEGIGYPLNLFTSLNFGYTSCPPDEVGKAFQELRYKFSRWLTRPPASRCSERVPATFIWVIERPKDSSQVDCHILAHVPPSRHTEFNEKLAKWLATVAGPVVEERAAIHTRPAPTPRGVGKYMLKGMHPSWAAHFDIRHEPQAEVYGRRSGFTKNLGPTQKRRLRAEGKYPKSRTWVSFRQAS